MFSTILFCGEIIGDLVLWGRGSLLRRSDVRFTLAYAALRKRAGITVTLSCHVQRVVWRCGPRITRSGPVCAGFLL